MIAQAKARAARRGLSGRCRFLVQDTAALEAGEQFDLVLGVTVLQHILDPDSLRSAVQRMSEHLSPYGRMVLLEAAPVELASRCDSSVFKARPRSYYLKLFEECGLKVQAITGVDPAPFKTWLLPYLPRMPRPLGIALLALATAVSVPIDLFFGRIAVNRSWHAVFVLEHADGSQHAH
jgi:hypothetical protein